ncbi:hypothetical protein [Salidesulfovibrio brasiliensis]
MSARLWFGRTVLVAVMFLCASSPALAAEGAGDTAAAAAAIIFKYLIVVTIFESVYSAIFQWTWFIKKGEKKGLKTPVKVLLGWLAVVAYPAINIMEELSVDIFGATPGSGDEWVGQLVTALLIAGGSSGMFDILNKIGFRDREEVQRKIDRVLGNHDQDGDGGQQHGQGG